MPAKAAPRAGLPAFIDRELDSFFDTLFEDERGGFRRWPSLFRQRLAALAENLRLASVDVYETDDEVVIKAEMPGMARENINISVTDSTLTIKGEKTREEKVEKEDYRRSERSFGMISRRRQLSCDGSPQASRAPRRPASIDIRCVTFMRHGRNHSSSAIGAPGGV